MGEKINGTIVLILAISLTVFVCVSFVTYNRAEQIDVYAEGIFGQIEVSDTADPAYNYFDFELDSENLNLTIMTGQYPIVRVIEIRIYKNEGIFDSYEPYQPDQDNIYTLANVTIVMTSGYEPIGYANKAEIGVVALGSIVFFLFSIVMFVCVVEVIDRKVYLWRRTGQLKKEKYEKLEAKRRKKEEEELG